MKWGAVVCLLGGLILLILFSFKINIPGRNFIHCVTILHLPKKRGLKRLFPQVGVFHLLLF